MNQQTQLAVKEQEATAIIEVTTEEMTVRQAVKFETLNQQEKLIKAHRESTRSVVEDAINRNGVVDQKGSVIWEAYDCIMKRQRSESPSFNAAAAEIILKEKGLWDTCKVTIVTTREEIDTDKIIELYEAGKISPQEYEQMFTVKESFSLIVQPDTDVYKEYGLIKACRMALEKGDMTTAEHIYKELMGVGVEKISAT